VMIGGHGILPKAVSLDRREKMISVNNDVELLYCRKVWDSVWTGNFSVSKHHH
jgi:hypothetical protein